VVKDAQRANKSRTAVANARQAHDEGRVKEWRQERAAKRQNALDRGFCSLAAYYRSGILWHQPRGAK
jgi:hypothetical protein